MTHREPVLPTGLPSIGAALEQLYDQFETALRNGKAPSIEQYLDGPGFREQRTTILRELILLELDYRYRQGEALQIDEYVRRFPDDSGWIEPLFADAVKQHHPLSTIAHQVRSPAGEPGVANRQIPVTATLSVEWTLLWSLLAVDRQLVTSEMLHEFLSHRPTEAPGPIGEQMYELGLITSAIHDHIQEAIQSHIAAHDNDLVQSLDAFPHLQDLRRELETLLVSSVIPTAEFDSQPSDETFDLPLKPAQWSRFRALRSHAQGGLGEVFVALDQELDRHVALKEIRSKYADRSEARYRFLIEAEITGKLEHPGIVPVYGLGAYPDGRPYYAMRFIHGTSMQKVLQRVTSSVTKASFDFELRKLLRRFVDVCQAMDYAHSRGIIHRDIKPDNIMLGEYGETLVVDWGLAKRIHTPSSERSDVSTSPPIRLTLSGDSVGMETQYGSAMGTPQFMSPEQASGQLDEIGPASDVYSLGATLYSILTGQPPFAPESLQNLLAKVMLGNFPPPRQINPGIARPLEAICLHAMALDPGQRYSSAGALAEDVERWLSDEPVGAYQESLLERSWRWVRRHRSWAVAGTLSILTVAVVALFAAVQINHARNVSEHHRSVAERHRSEAIRRLHEARDAVDTWLTGASDVLENFPGVQQVRQRLLEQAVARYTQFASEVSDDPALELERSRSLLRVGDVYKLLGKTEQAEKSYRGALTVLSTFDSSYESFREVLLDRASAALRLGTLFADLEQHDEALLQFEAAATPLESLVSDGRVQRIQGSILVNRAASMSALGQHAAAESLTRQAVALLADAQKQLADNLPLKMELAHAQRTLADLLAQQGQADESLHWLTESIREIELVVVRYPDEPAYREQSAASQIALALTLRRRGDIEAEQQAYQDAAENYRALLKALPDVPRYRESLALTQLDIAQSLQDSYRAAAAEPMAVEAQRRIESLAQEFPQLPRYVEQVAGCYDVVGLIERDLGRIDSARKAFDIASQLFDKLASEHPDTMQYRHRALITRSHVATSLYRQNDIQLADEQSAKVISGLEQLVQEFPELVELTGSLGYVHYQQGLALTQINRADAAKSAFQQAIVIWEKLAASPGAVDYQHRLVWLLLNAPDVSLRNPVRALNILKAHQALPANGTTRLLQASAKLRQGEYQNTIDQLTAAGESSDARQSLLLAIALGHLKRTDEARRALMTAREWIQLNAPDNLELRLLEKEASQIVNESL